MSLSGPDPIARLVLDTSAYSQMRARHSDAVRLIARAGAILIPATVLGELEGAFELGSRTAENRAALSRFLAEPLVSVLPTTQEVAGRYGNIYARLRRAGTPVTVNDMWIAAATIDCGGTLLTFDRDFERIDLLDRLVLDP